MYEFDNRLCALAGCPVIEAEKNAMTFNPNPIITAKNDLILSHEICHILAGRRDFEVFATAVLARDNNEMFRHVLNMLYDWYHELLYGQYSGFLYGKLNALHKMYNYIPTGIPIIDDLNKNYFDRKRVIRRKLNKESIKVKSVVDLVAIADHIVEDILSNHMKAFNQTGIFQISEADINTIPKRSNYYISAVSRYFHIIKELMNLWKKNRYGWVNNYYGEINWKDLPGMFQGEKFSLPVWRLFQKIGISRKIYLVIDRSGSTVDICNTIMDTAIIITESLRMLGIPISILDVGVTNNVVNSIEGSLDLSWFTPMAEDGTPLGEVCSLITKADIDSYLLIITDGCPNSWEPLVSALNAFPGKNLTFVIGDDYGRYIEEIKNVIHVEPHTIIREVLHETALA